MDRGSFSSEVMLTLLALKVYSPESIHLTRGNHESQNMNRIYGFEGEVRTKYSVQVFHLFSELFQSLPLAYVLDGKVGGAEGGRRAFIVHGGLFSRDGVTLGELQKLNRRCEPDSGLVAEMLWSDPQEADGWGPSKRGIGVAFGPDVTRRFLDSNDLDIVVRSHEMKDEGYEVGAGGRLITIFSAPNYCDQMGNKGAYIIFGHKMEPEFIQFTAVPVSYCSPCDADGFVEFILTGMWSAPECETDAIRVVWLRNAANLDVFIRRDSKLVGFLFLVPLRSILFLFASVRHTSPFALRYLHHSGATRSRVGFCSMRPNARHLRGALPQYTNCPKFVISCAITIIHYFETTHTHTLSH